MQPRLHHKAPAGKTAGLCSKSHGNAGSEVCAPPLCEAEKGHAQPAKCGDRMADISGLEDLIE